MCKVQLNNVELIPSERKTDFVIMYRLHVGFPHIGDLQGFCFNLPER